MTNQRRKDLIAQLRLLSLVNPKKWQIMNDAANEIERLSKGCGKVSK